MLGYSRSMNITSRKSADYVIIERMWLASTTDGRGREIGANYIIFQNLALSSGDRDEIPETRCGSAIQWNTWWLEVEFSKCFRKL